MKSFLKSGKAIDREVWKEFLLRSPQGALYAHPDYLDIVAPDWQGIEVWRDQEMVAVMPIQLKQKAGYTYALQPSFSQFWGIFFAPMQESNYKEFSLKRKIVKAALEAIPEEVKWFLHGFAPEFDYPHPFHWAGYELMTRYTYRLPLQHDYALVEASYSSDTRYEARKAQKEGYVTVPSTNMDGLLSLVKQNHEKGKHMLTAEEMQTLKQLERLVGENGLLQLIELRDDKGELAAAALTGSYAGKTSYLMSAQAVAAQGSGAMNLCLAKAIENACQQNTIFDFEGSMIEGIEAFFRGFGGRPEPYLIIEKNQLPLFVRWIRKLR